MPQISLFCFFLLLFNVGATAAPTGDSTATTPAEFMDRLLGTAKPNDTQTGPPGDEKIPGVLDQDYSSTTQTLPLYGNETSDKTGGTVGTDAPEHETTLSTDHGDVTTETPTFPNFPGTVVSTSGTVTDKSTATSISGSVTDKSTAASIPDSMSTTSVPSSPASGSTTTSHSVHTVTPEAVVILHTTPTPTLSPVDGTPSTTSFTDKTSIPSSILDETCIKVLPESLLRASDSWSNLDVQDDGFLTPDWSANVNGTIVEIYDLFLCGNNIRQWLAFPAADPTVSFN